MRPARTVVLVVLATCALSMAPGASAATRCVGGPGCYPTLQAAADAAADGDTIALGAGTFDGGVTIDVRGRRRGHGGGRAPGRRLGGPAGDPGRGAGPDDRPLRRLPRAVGGHRPAHDRR